MKKLPYINQRNYGEELKEFLSLFLDPENGGLNQWSVATRPWADGSTDKDEYNKLITGYNTEYKFLEQWRGSPLNRWVPLQSTSRSEKKVGQGTISSSNDDIAEIVFSVVIPESEIGVGSTIYVGGVGGRSTYIIKKISDTRFNVASVDLSNSVAGAGTITTVAGSNAITGNGVNFLSQGYQIGDHLTSFNSGSRGMVVAVNATTITINSSARFTETAVSYTIVKKLQPTGYEYEIPPLKIENSDGNLLGYFVASGSLYSPLLTGEILAVKDKKLFVGGVLDKPNFSSFSSEISVPSGESAGTLRMLPLLSAFRLGAEANGGSVARIIGQEINGGHFGLGITGTTTRADILSIGIFADSGVLTESRGINLYSTLDVASVTSAFGVYENLSIDATKARNYFKNRVGIGLTAPSSPLHVSGNGVFTGTCTATSFPVSSDSRLKTDVNEFSGGLDAVLGLNIKTFYYRQDIVASEEVPAVLGEKGEEISSAISQTLYSFPRGVQVGVIADEVSEWFPESVVRGADGYNLFRQEILPPINARAIQELYSLVQSLEEEINQLKTQVEELKNAAT